MSTTKPPKVVLMEREGSEGRNSSYSSLAEHATVVKKTQSETKNP